MQNGQPQDNSLVSRSGALEAYHPPKLMIEARTAPQAAAGTEWVQFADTLRFVCRNLWLLASFAVVGVLTGVLLSWATTPVFRATSLIEIIGVNEEFLNLRNIDPTGRLPAESYLQTQVEVLQSEALMRRVVERFQLEQKPEFTPEPGIGERLNHWLGLDSEQPVARQVLAIQTAQQRLQVTPSRQSRVIRLSFDSRDPQLAQEVVNALGEVYMARDLESRSASAAKVRQWLSPQLAELKQKVDQAEARLQAYSRANALVFAGERETASDERLRQVQRDLAAAQAERMARESMLVMAKKATGDTMPPALDTGALRDLRARITELKRQRAEVAALFTDESQRVQRVQAQIDELESAYRREQSAIPERAENEFRAARMREDSLSAEYAARAAAALDEGRKRLRYEALKHEVDTNRRLYDAMSDRMNEADVATAIKPSAARILSPAKYPNLPYRPNLPLNVALGLGGGLCLGLVFTALRETWRNGIGSPLEATAILQLPALGTVPSAANGLVSSRLTARLLQRPANPDSVELVTWREKQSLVSESFREILASIVFNGDQRVLLVTSPEAAEGKTTVACNLAIALNEIGKRVLLIDGDRRRPSVHRIFHKSNEWGLSNLLDGGEASLEAPTIALVTATDIPGLFILPSGASRSWFSLLDSARMEAVINRFRTEFDYVLVDTPPALHFSEARLVSRYTDGVLLVVRANHTDSIRVREAAARLSAAGARILGIILNRWDHQRPDYSTRYRYARYER